QRRGQMADTAGLGEKLPEMTLLLAEVIGLRGGDLRAGGHGHRNGGKRQRPTNHLVLPSFRVFYVTLLLGTARRKGLFDGLSLRPQAGQRGMGEDYGHAAPVSIHA